MSVEARFLMPHITAVITSLLSCFYDMSMGLGLASHVRHQFGLMSGTVDLVNITRCYLSAGVFSFSTCS